MSVQSTLKAHISHCSMNIAWNIPRDIQMNKVNGEAGHLHEILQYKKVTKSGN